MKKLALAVWVLSISAASAFAADLPVKAYKAPVMAVYDWSGWYVGANGGYGWSHKCWDLEQFLGVSVLEAAEGCANATGGLAGGQFGYRWQTPNAWVFGFDVQGDWAGLKGRRVSNPIALGGLGPLVTNESRVNAIGQFNGTAGVAWNNALFFVRSGIAVTSDKYRGLFTPTGVAFDEARETRIGYDAGVGFEYGFTPNWSFAFVYDHLFMFTSALGFSAIPGGFSSRVDNIHQDVDLVTVRVNYHFGGPIVARY